MSNHSAGGLLANLEHITASNYHAQLGALEVLVIIGVIAVDIDTGTRPGCT